MMYTDHPADPIRSAGSATLTLLVLFALYATPAPLAAASPTPQTQQDPKRVALPEVNKTDHSDDPSSGSHGSTAVIGQTAEAVAAGCARTIRADVVALDQVLIWNKFGSKDPAGMVFALARDVVNPADPSSPPTAGNAMIRPDLRPRPLVLRVNAGDCLQVHFTNLLDPSQWDLDTPRTRSASFHVGGLAYMDIGAAASNLGHNGNTLANPGQSRTYTYMAPREGVFLAVSMGAMSGGEADGGSTAHGLFGAVIVEPEGSEWLHPVTGIPLLDPGTTEINSGPAVAIIQGFDDPDDGIEFTAEGPFREFVAIFHDEVNTLHANPLLDTEFWLSSVRDAFGINYGISGMGQLLLDGLCAPDCRYEEMFLSAWSNGDPALRAEFPDDPSNVWHSYMGDRVVFRNLSAGPKETHVFHLHAHQWVKSPDNDNSVYLDSQSIGPGGTFTYDIAYGGSGNRNYTPGDSIFHCHLYPHFAQGMWGLWRVHDVYEDGKRLLPDGTPIPRIAPIPGHALPPLPSRVLPGYPFFIPGIYPHRAPQAPMDIAVDSSGNLRDGGLPRHIIINGPTVGGVFDRQFIPGTLTNISTIADAAPSSPETAGTNVIFLPQNGTPLERAAMAFHASREMSTHGPWGSVRSILWNNATSDPTPQDYATLPAAPFRVNGLPPAPGAPYANPCPPGSPDRKYAVSAIDLDMVINDTGWHDPQGRINVLDGDVAATLNGTRPPEPFFFRVNSNDCVTFEHTNRTARSVKADDFQVETPTDIIGQHIHLVKFDVTASDGSANGWNYEDGTFSPEEIANRLAAMGLPRAPGSFQTTTQRWWADPLINGQGKDRTIRTVFTHDHFSPSTIQQHGFYGAMVVEPEGSTWWDSDTGQRLGTRADGGPTSWRADIHKDDKGTREFCLAIADFAIVYDEAGNPINPPKSETGVPTPEAISAADPGTMVMNYRNEPIPLRIGKKPDGVGSSLTSQLKPGIRGRMPWAFSSRAHGDPGTPILKVYQGDNVEIRLIQGAQEESHVFGLSRAKWFREPGMEKSGYVSTQTIGISEHFEFDFKALAMKPIKALESLAKDLSGNAAAHSFADLLWSDESEDGIWNGVWGFMRVFRDRQAIDPETDQRVQLQPLPDNRDRKMKVRNGGKFKWPCPKNAPIRRYNVVAVAARDVIGPQGIVYNAAHQILDDTGLMYVLAKDLDSTGHLTKPPEPLILRANAGDCLKIRLTNRLPRRRQMPDRPANDAFMPPITHLNVKDMRTDNVVGMTVDLCFTDARTGDGSALGYNPSSLVKRGKSRVYTYYCGTLRYEDHAEKLKPVATPLGICGIRSFGDVIKQGSQGLIGAVIVEPRGSIWRDPDTGLPAPTGAVAEIATPSDSGAPPIFKEFVLVQQDGLNLAQGSPNNPIPDVGDDAEDAGEKAYNYRTAPHWARVGSGSFLDPDQMNDVDQSNLLSGIDPATPVFRANVGDRVVFRLCQPAGRARAHTFTVDGHSWLDEPENPDSQVMGSQTIHSVGMTWNLWLLDGAGGPNGVAGDYLFHEMASFQYSQGLWGIFRVQ